MSTSRWHTAVTRPVRRFRTSRTTFSTYYSSYAQRQLWAPQTTRAVDLAVRTFPQRDLPLPELRREHLEAWARAMHDEGLAVSTIRCRIATVRAVLYAAARDGLVADNAAVGIRLPRTTTRATSAVLPTGRQVAHLLEVSPAPYDRVFALCAYAGLRLGEARALCWGDVDLDHRVLTVRRQLRLSPGGGSEKSPPKYGSYRSIPVSAELSMTLRPHVGRDDLLVAPAAAGGPLHPGSIHRVWTQVKRSGDLPHDLRLHDLRHWFASRLIAEGVDILTLQRRLGHAHASTTLDVYGHVLADDC